MPLSLADSRRLVSSVAALALDRIKSFEEFRRTDEYHRSQVGDAIMDEAEEVVRAIVHMVSARGFAHEAVEVKKLVDGSSPEVVLKLVGDDPDWGLLHVANKQRVTLVLVSPDAFDEERVEPAIEPDEPELPLGEAQEYSEECSSQETADAQAKAADPYDLPPHLDRRPSTSDEPAAYHEGRRAYETGAKSTDCPHPGSARKLRRQWSQGWADRQQEAEIAAREAAREAAARETEPA